MIELRKKGLLEVRVLANLNYVSIGSLGSRDELSSPRVFHNTKGTLDYLHSDLWGPSKVPSNGGANYMLSIIDDFFKSV